MEETKKRKGAPSPHLFVPNEVHLLVSNRAHLAQTNIRVIQQEDGNVISEQESARLIWTRLYFDFPCQRCHSPHDVQDVISLVFPIKTPRICVNCALINEIILFGIISELISRITRSLSLFYSVYLRKFTATLILYSRKETRSLASDPRFHAQLPFFVIELGFKQRKGVFFDTFLKPCIKTLRMGCC